MNKDLQIKIRKPQFRIEKVDVLPEEAYQEPNTNGWLFHTEKEGTYMYAYEHQGKCYLPICNCEYAFDTPEEAANSIQAWEFAIGEDMFPDFKQSIGETLRDYIDSNLATELMADRECGDIAPDQQERIEEAIDEIAQVLVSVWAFNPAKKGA